MKLAISILALSLSSLPSFAALDGGASTGGGGAFVCYNPDGSVRDSELLDLWEGRNIREWNIPYSDDPVEAQIAAALAKLNNVDNVIYSQVIDDLQFVRNNHRYLPAEVDLAPPSDAQNSFQKPGCPLRGMMLFQGESSQLLIKNEIFSRLFNSTNTAAAWLHEALYKTLRSQGYNSNSINARKLTACLFSTEDCLPGVRLEDALPTDRDVYECETAGYPVKFYLYLKTSKPNGHGGISNSWAILMRQLGSATFPSATEQQITYGFDANGSLREILGGGWSGGPFLGYGYNSGMSCPGSIDRV